MLYLGEFTLEHLSNMHYYLLTGEFGVVYRGRLGSKGISCREVAIKTLKGLFKSIYTLPLMTLFEKYSFEGCFDQLETDKFVEESLTMSRFKHAHVMGLIGVCLDAGSAPYIVMPYMANGSLLHYLKRERKNLIFTENTDRDEVCMVQANIVQKKTFRDILV